jgi:alkylhydroperoxidase family enzyme
MQAESIQWLLKTANTDGAPLTTLEMVHARVKQINDVTVPGCAVNTATRKAGISDAMLAAWQETPYFDEAERSALALAEAATELTGSADSIPAGVWDAAVAHFGENGAAGLVITIATTNLLNRLNASTKQFAATVA